MTGDRALERLGQRRSLCDTAYEDRTRDPARHDADHALGWGSEQHACEPIRIPSQVPAVRSTLRRTMAVNRPSRETRAGSREGVAAARTCCERFR
jgi:hypothetical protein